MKILSRNPLLTVALLVLLTGSLAAQESSEPAPDAEASQETVPTEPADAPDEQPAEAPDTANPVDQAFPVGGAPTEPEFTTEVFGDWELRCTADNSECFLYQLVTNEAGDPVSEITVIALPPGGEAVTGATVVTPLGTLLTAGVRFRVDGGEIRQYPFSWCLRSGCFARFGFDANGLAGLKNGNVAHMILAAIDIPDQPINLQVSLKGFTAGYNALAAKQPQ